jgi:hypothetical protein
MAGKKVSLSKVLAELRAVISELEKEDPTWTDQQKKRAKSSSRVMKNLADLAENECTDGAQGIPN